MKSLLTFLANALLLSAALSSSSFAASTPTISQVFGFSCNQNFTACPNGFDPALLPVQLSNGLLYGTTWWAGQGTANAGGTVFQVSTAGKVAVLHTFSPGTGGNFLRGENPVLGFVLGNDGAFYGVTESGGAHKAGVFYKVTTSGAFQVLYNFCSLPGCPDGPGAIVLGNDGNFYGAEYETIFRLTPQGKWTLVYGLNASTDGAALTLIKGSDGNFYGTGTKANETGTLFQVTPAGQFTLLYTLAQFELTTTSLVEGTDGNFYGGISGGIFQFTPSGTFTVIAQLTQAEGPTPSFLLQASDGNLWGLARSGGIDPMRSGTVFSVSTTGAILSYAPFICEKTGCNPESMLQGSDGKFYGVAITGGSAPINPLGTVFKIDAGLDAPGH